MDMDADTHTKYARNGKVMLGTAILLFLMLLIIIFLHTYSCFCFRRRHRQRHLPPNRHLLPTLSASTAAANSKGLDPSLFKFLPTFTYSSASHRPLQECAVCLSEFEEGDEGRVLPNCNHGFHTPCIDTWFRSHSSCPICRAAVQPLKIPAQRKETCVPEGELAGCSYLPPPIGCPRKALDVELRWEELDGGESGLKSSDEQILRLKGIWR